MNIAVNHKHLIVLGVAITAVLMGVFVAYPKYQEYRDQQDMRAFYGMDETQAKRNV